MMAEISNYCEDGDLKGLTEFLGNKNMAIGFMLAHEEMRGRRDEPAYKELNKIHDKMQGKE